MLNYKCQYTTVINTILLQIILSYMKWMKHNTLGSYTIETQQTMQTLVSKCKMKTCCCKLKIRKFSSYSFITIFSYPAYMQWFYCPREIKNRQRLPLGLKLSLWPSSVSLTMALWMFWMELYYNHLTQGKIQNKPWEFGKKFK